MELLTNSEIDHVQGGGAWDDFWSWVGHETGMFIAKKAYSRSSKSVHDVGSGKSNQSLDQFLAGQNDPLL